jgi:hypothetical protein
MKSSREIMNENVKTAQVRSEKLCERNLLGDENDNVHVALRVDEEVVD